MDEYAYANGSYDNNLDLSESEVVQQPLPVRQEVYFRMSQVFADPKLEVKDPEAPNLPDTKSSNPQVLDPNGLYGPSSPFYETSVYDASPYYDAFDPNQNTYSATFPRTAHGTRDKQEAGQGAPNISHGPLQQNGVSNRLYEPASANHSTPHYGPGRVDDVIPTNNHTPLWDNSQGGERRQDSIIHDHLPPPDVSRSRSTSPISNHATNTAMGRTASDATMYAQNNGIQGNARHVAPSPVPKALQNRTSRGFPQKPPRGPEVSAVPVPPRVPEPQPTRRAPPAPPPRRSSQNQDGTWGPESELKQNGCQPEHRIFLNKAEEGVTWC